MAEQTVLRPLIDAERVRMLAGRRAGARDFIAREVGRRLIERLEYIKLEATSILEAGPGDAPEHRALLTRFPKAEVIEADFALAPLLSVREQMRGPWPARLFQKAPAVRWMCGDFGRLPLASRSLDLVYSNLALAVHPDLGAVFGEWSRLLRPGGLVMFSSFGPDTLREVRTAFRSLDAAPHVLEFPDMHDVGDLLVAAGLADPVVDIEMITLTYSNEEALWRDVKAMGGNLLQGRRRGLLGRNASRKVSDGLGATRLSGGEWVLTFEIIYGHAWKVEPRRRADGSVPIRIETKRKSDATPGA